MIGSVHESYMKENNTCSSNPKQPHSSETQQQSILSDGKFACSTNEPLSINSTAASSEGNIKSADVVRKHLVINWREMGAFRCEECAFTTTEESISQAHKTICRKRKRPLLENSCVNTETSPNLLKKARTESLSNDLPAKGSSLPICDSNTKSTTMASAFDCRAIKPKTAPTYPFYQITSEPSRVQLISGQHAVPNFSPEQPFQMVPGQQGVSVIQGLQPVLGQQQISQVSPKQPFYTMPVQQGVSVIQGLQPILGQQQILQDSTKQPFQLISGQQTDACAQGLQLLPLSFGSVTSNPSQLQFSGQQSIQMTSGKQIIPSVTALEPFFGSRASGKFVTESAPISASQPGACQPQNYYVQPVILMPVGEASNHPSGGVESMTTTVSQAKEIRSSFLNAPGSLTLQSGSAVSTVEGNGVSNVDKSSDSENFPLPKIVSTVSLAGIDHSFLNDKTPVSNSSNTSDVAKKASQVNDSDYYTAVSLKYVQNDKTVEIKLTKTQKHFLCNMCKVKTQRISVFQSHLHDHIHSADVCEKCTSESSVEDCAMLRGIMKKLLGHNMENKQPRSTTPEHRPESKTIDDSNTDDKISKTLVQTQSVTEPISCDCNKDVVKLCDVENEIESDIPLKKQRQERLVNTSSPETSSTSRISDPMIAENYDSGSFYKCAFDSCQFSSLNSSNFLTHLLVNHRGDKCYPCAHCRVACKDGNSLIQHMSCHVKCKKFVLYQCAAKPLSYVGGIKVCGFGTNDLAQFLSHVQVHHGNDRNYSCAKCGFVLDSPEMLRDHLQANLLKFIQCPYCSAKDKNRRVIQQHIGSEHSGKAKHIRVTSELACCRKVPGASAVKNSVTKASVTSVERLDAETTECSVPEKVDDKDRKQFLCQYCGELFTAFSSFRLHVYDKHIIEEGKDHCIIQIFQCKYCTDYRTTCQETVESHVLNTHPSNHPSDSNGFKKMRFTMKKREAQQMQGHSPVFENIQNKRFICSFCDGATYEDFSSLKSHIYQEHLQKEDFDCMNVLLYKCDRCDYRSTSKHNVGRHVSQAHGTDDILILKQNIKISKADCLSVSTIVELNSSDNSEEVFKQQNIDKHEHFDQGPPANAKGLVVSSFNKLSDKNDNSESSHRCSVLQRDKMQAHLNSSDTACNALAELTTNFKPTEVFEHNNSVKQSVPPVTKCIPQIQREIIKNVLPISQNFNHSADGVDSVTSVPNIITLTDDSIATNSHPSFGALCLDVDFKDCYSIQSTGHYSCLFCKYISKGVIALTNRISMHRHLMGGKHLDMHLYRCGLCQFKCLTKTGIMKHSQKRHMAKTVILPIENEPLTTLIAEYRKKLDAENNTRDKGTDAMINGVSELMPEDSGGSSIAQEQFSHVTNKSKETEKKNELHKKWRVKLISKSNSLSSDENAEASDLEMKPKFPNEQSTAVDRRSDNIVADIPELCVKRERMTVEDEESSMKLEKTTVKIEKESPIKKSDEVYGVISDDDDDDHDAFDNFNSIQKSAPVHQPLGLQYRCPKCSFVTSSLSAFEEHLPKHIQSPLSIVRQRCAYCCFSTKSQREFEMHRSTHVTHKSFSCIFCSYRAFHAYKIRQHCKMKHPTLEASVLEIASRENNNVLRKEQDCNQLQSKPAVSVTDLYAMNTMQMKQLLQSENIATLRLSLSTIKPILKYLEKDADLVAL